MKTVILKAAILLAVAASFQVAAQGGGLGGNPTVESGAANVGIGKCTAYKLEVMAAKKNNTDVESVVKPKGC